MMTQPINGRRVVVIRRTLAGYVIESHNCEDYFRGYEFGRLAAGRRAAAVAESSGAEVWDMTPEGMARGH